MTKFEQETIMSMNEAEDTMEIYTASPAHIRTGLRYGLEVVQEDKHKGERQAVTFKSLKISFADICRLACKKQKPKKQYTEEEKAALLARFKNRAS